jgi:hypothetical protein
MIVDAELWMIFAAIFGLVTVGCLLTNPHRDTSGHHA